MQYQRYSKDFVHCEAHVFQRLDPLTITSMVIGGAEWARSTTADENAARSFTMVCGFFDFNVSSLSEVLIDPFRLVHVTCEQSDESKGGQRSFSSPDGLPSALCLSVAS